MIPDSPVEGFAVETVEGLIFTVKGLVHPGERVIAYLRYLPDPCGDRLRHGTPYRRIYQFQEQEAILKEGYPLYRHRDPCVNLELQSVPRDRIARVYSPCETLARICETGPGPHGREALTEACARFGRLLARTAGIPLSCLGISGSVLLGLARPDSDLDLVVYGLEAGARIHRALGELMAQEGPVNPLDENGLKHLHAQHRPDTPISFDEFARLQGRKHNEGTFEGISFFMRFIPLESEMEERYGDPGFTPRGRVTLQARVTRSDRSIYSPCFYDIDHCRPLSGTCPGPVTQMVSFRGRFTDQARDGEWIQARGVVEEVMPLSGPSRFRLNLGSGPGDYLVGMDPKEQPHGL